MQKPHSPGTKGLGCLGLPAHTPCFGRVHNRLRTQADITQALAALRQARPEPEQSESPSSA